MGKAIEGLRVWPDGQFSGLQLKKFTSRKRNEDHQGTDTAKQALT